MPLLRNGDRFPDWCEMSAYQIVTLAQAETMRLQKNRRKETLFVCEGSCKITVGKQMQSVDKQQLLKIDVPAGQPYWVEAVSAAVLVRLSGHWGEEVGHSGVFQLAESDTPRNDGDPTDYSRNTIFDNHYHDFDEYWIIAKGRGKVVTEEQSFQVEPGDCVATRMGDHHDFPEVYETVTGVYFETTLRGAKRLGHLWEHTHSCN